MKFIGVVEKISIDESKIHVHSKFCDGLKGIAQFSHLIIIYWIHLRDTEADRCTLRVYPRRHKVKIKTGVFACRSPSRPNPLGLCVVELTAIDGCTLTVKGLDAFDETPIVDIKPYLPRANSVHDAIVPEWVLKGPST
ncbi:MAG: tRNA (N6-threonylcarbamoyladenosine(37)-N6)-methyltransferase TrmO [Candidatus Bathyarchaeota archaeon]|nr:MAG: tRNA (N6-threonylcarbamoyladenosine(37)-N6)-methyltransferase TrmO [Candidatus Bathyarchaeota archaeon]